MEQDFSTTRGDLYERLLNETHVLRTDELRRAFSEIDRKDFVPDDYIHEAYEDYPLPIGFDQTISQPTTVAFMLELLQVSPGQHVLDIGSGSGWTSVLLGNLVGESGTVKGTECIEELVNAGRRHVAIYSMNHVSIVYTPNNLGIPGDLFDRILVSADVASLPTTLEAQLKPEGILVIPIRGSITVFEKRGNSLEKIHSYPGFTFVPLQHD